MGNGRNVAPQKCKRVQLKLPHCSRDIIEETKMFWQREWGKVSNNCVPHAARSGMALNVMQ